MVYDRTKDKDQAVFNPALQYLEGMIKLLNICDDQFLDEDLEGVFRTLQRIFSRVEHKFTEEESVGITELIEKCKSPYVRPDLNKQQKKKLYYDNLTNIDKKLKRLMDSYGLLMPNVNDPRFAVLE